MTSSATRRKRLREQRRSAELRARDEVGFSREDGSVGDSVFGWDLKPYRSGVGRARLRWVIDRDPYSALVALPRVRSVLDGLEDVLVDELRADAFSWDDIGFALDVTGEAARKRHGRRSSA